MISLMIIATCYYTQCTIASSIYNEGLYVHNTCFPSLWYQNCRRWGCPCWPTVFSMWERRPSVIASWPSTSKLLSPPWSLSSELSLFIAPLSSLSPLSLSPLSYCTFIVPLSSTSELFLPPMFLSPVCTCIVCECTVCPLCLAYDIQVSSLMSSSCVLVMCWTCAGHVQNCGGCASAVTLATQSSPYHVHTSFIRQQVTVLATSWDDKWILVCQQEV